MKRIFTITAVLIVSAILLAGCTKRDYLYDEDYWLSRERGVVVYSDAYCPYYVVETRNGYTIINSQSGITPYEGSIIYGDLSRIGSMDLYDYSSGTIIRGSVKEYWLTYAEAQNEIGYFC